jgi:hypothetical protein
VVLIFMDLVRFPETATQFQRVELLYNNNNDAYSFRCHTYLCHQSEPLWLPFKAYIRLIRQLSS